MARRRFLLCLTATVLAAAVILTGSIARADEDRDHDNVPDSFEIATERNVAVASSSHSISISSRSVAAPVDDRFNVTYEAGEFRVAYFRDASSDRITGSYRLAVSNLIEWVDENGNGILESPEEEAWALGSSAFGDVPILHVSTAGPDGGRVESFTIESSNGEVTLGLMISERFLRLPSGRILTPMEVKLDIHIDHNLSEPGARVGLEFRMNGPDTMRYEEESWDDRQGYSADESWVNVTEREAPSGPSSTVFFSWDRNATVNGVTGSVESFVPAGHDGGMYVLDLLYPAAPDTDRVHIEHDPMLGVVSAAFQGIAQLEPPIGGNGLLYGLSLVGMAAVVVGTVLLSRRGRAE